MASIVRFDKFYPATSGTMGAAAQVNDVLVIACGSNTLNHATATVTGATATMVEQQFQSGTGGLNNAITILTGVVTGAGTPAFNTSGDSDMGFGCWIVRGLSSATKNTGSGAFGVGNPLTATVNPSVVCTLLIAYLNENTNSFTSWNGSINPEGADASHADAYGDQLAVPSGSISPGANVTSHGDNTIAFIFLPETAAAAASDGKPTGPFHADGPGQGPRMRRMYPQRFPVPNPPDVVPAISVPFTRGSRGGPMRRTEIPQKFADFAATATTVLSPPEGVLTLAGNAASITLALAVVAGSLSLSGNAPSITQSLAPSSGSITISGNAPNRVQALGPSSGTVVVSGNAPGIAVGSILSPAEGAVVLSGNTPSLSQQIQGVVGAIVISGNAPNIFGTGITTPQTAGNFKWLKKKKRKPVKEFHKKVVVETPQEVFVAVPTSSLQEVLASLEKTGLELIEKEEEDDMLILTFVLKQ